MAQTVELSGENGKQQPRVGAGDVAVRADSRGPDPRGPDPLIGKHLLHYIVLEVIGQGGMSVVYRGYDEKLQRDVAIKVLHPFLAEKPECRQRLAREARAVARLQHPSILKVFDFSGEPESLQQAPQAGDRVRGFAEGFIVAELVRGHTLKGFMGEHTLWCCPEVGAMVVWQVAKALEHAHQNGIVHRDIKPENIMVATDGTLKLMDFGIAQIADQAGLTLTGTLLGSPAHMAPECIDGEVADERSDVFALGTVLYWACTGALPFEAHSPHALLKIIVEGRFAPPQQKSPRVSDDLARVIVKALARRPADRYQRAAALADALEDALVRADLPPSMEALRALLCDAPATVDVARGKVRTAFLARARDLLTQGASARAIGCLNRVLADDKDDITAKELLATVAVSDDESAPHHGPAADPAEPSMALVSAPTRDTPGEPLLSQSALSSQQRAASVRLPKVAAGVFVTLVAFALVATAVWVATRFDEARAPLITVLPAAAVVVDDVQTSTGEPAPTTATATEPAKTAAAHNKAHDVKPIDRPADALVVVANVRSVLLRARPFADMTVDGRKIAVGQTTAPVELAAGAHTAVFTHPSAQTQSVPFEVPTSGPTKDVVVDMEPLPARLVVRCSVKDAIVQVGNQGAMLASETEARNFPIVLGRSFRANREVTVYKRGFALFKRTIEFRAGEVTTLDDVVLQPQTDATGMPQSTP